MKKATISISFDQEKLRALQFYAGKKDSSLEAELDDFMTKLYEKYVPAQTREYIESMAESTEKPKSRPNRPDSRPSREGAFATGVE